VVRDVVAQTIMPPIVPKIMILASPRPIDGIMKRNPYLSAKKVSDHMAPSRNEYKMKKICVQTFFETTVYSFFIFKS